MSGSVGSEVRGQQVSVRRLLCVGDRLAGCCSERCPSDLEQSSGSADAQEARRGRLSHRVVRQKLSVCEIAHF